MSTHRRMPQHVRLGEHIMSTIFASYRTETVDEDYLRNYYNMTNFGGTAHTEDQRA